MNPYSRLNSLVGVESLEPRRLLAADAGVSPPDSEEISVIITSDTSGDGQITALDALQLINFLARSGVGTESERMDVNGRDGATELDALLIINRIAREGVDGPIKVDIGRLVSPGTRGPETEPVCLSDADRDELQTLFESLNKQRIEIGATSEEVAAVVDATVILADEATEDPSQSKVESLEALFQVVAADGTVSQSELSELRSAADEVLRSTGASLATIVPCLDGLDAIASRGITPAALIEIYDQTVTLLTNWSFSETTPGLEEQVRELTNQLLDPSPNFNQVITAINEVADPDGIYRDPSSLSVLRLFNAVQFAAQDDVLSESERTSIGEELAGVFDSMGIPTTENSDLVVAIDEVLQTLDF